MNPYLPIYANNLSTGGADWLMSLPPKRMNTSASPTRRRSRRVAFLPGIICLCLAAAMAIAAPAPDAMAAGSCDSPNGTHCYAIEQIPTGQNNGMYGRIQSTCLYYPGNSNSASVTTEMWNSSGDGSFWVEVGITSGAAADGTTKYRNWFWADSRPFGGGYHAHYPSTPAAANGPYPTEINWLGNNSYAVIGGNTHVSLGTSTDQPLIYGSQFAGTEYMASATSGIRDVGGISYLQWRDTSGAGHWWGNGSYSQGDQGPGHYISSSWNPSTSNVSWAGPC